MNIYAALTLSSRKQAIHHITRPVLGGVLVYQLYRLKLTLLENEVEQYRLEIYEITYPDRQEGKGRGDPQVAEKAHLSKEFTESELLAFFEKQGWTFAEGWYPFESER